MPNDLIEIGDEVSVQLDLEDQVMGVYGKVLHVPSSTGDSWHIRDHDGSLHYVQTYCQVIRKENHGNKDN